MSIQPDEVITQVAGPGPTVGFTGLDGIESMEYVHLNLRGTMFKISRDELLRLPESILIGISSGAIYDIDGVANPDASAAGVANTISPDCFQYTLDVFRAAAKDVPSVLLALDEPDLYRDPDYASGYEPDGDDNREGQDGNQHIPGEMPTETITDISEILRRRPAIIVLREDLDYYCLPTSPDIDVAGMHDLKRRCGDAILAQKSIFSGLRKSQDAESPEHHLIEMLCSSGFHIGDQWGFRSREPNRAVVSSLSLTPLVTEQEEPEHAEGEGHVDYDQLSTPHKLLLFWRKPARKCWWDSVDLLGVEGISGPLRVHIRRVWTLELSVIGVK